MDKSRVGARVGAIKPSATLAVDARAKAFKAAGEDVIGFGAGEPDFATPNHIVEAAVAACQDPVSHNYSPAQGQPALREAIATKTARDSGVEVDPTQVLVTNGGKHAIFNAFQTILDPGDEVLLPAPYWTTYPEPVRFAGATPIVLPTHEPSGFKVTVDQLDSARTEATKALVFVSPSNPTGAVYTPEETKAIGEWALENGVWMLTDEIYEHLTYGENSFESVLALVPGLVDHCIILNGCAKSYAMTGWRLGWMIAPSDVSRAATSLQSHSTSNVCNIAQAAGIAALTGDQSSIAKMRSEFDSRREVIHQMLNEIPGVSCLDPEGAFYAFPNLTGLVGKTFGETVPEDTLELADAVLEQAKVAFVPGEAFGAPGYGRFSFALDSTAMVEGVQRIHDLVTTAS